MSLTLTRTTNQIRLGNGGVAECVQYFQNVDQHIVLLNEAALKMRTSITKEEMMEEKEVFEGLSNSAWLSLRHADEIIKEYERESLDSQKFLIKSAREMYISTHKKLSLTIAKHKTVFEEEMEQKSEVYRDCEDLESVMIFQNNNENREFNALIVEERAKEVREIECEIAQLSEIMNDMALLTAEEREHLQTIEHQIEKSKIETSKAVITLESAERSAIAVRKKKVWIAVGVCIVILTLGIATPLYLKLKA